MKYNSLLLIACSLVSTAVLSNAATITLSRGSGNPGVIASADGVALSTGGYYWATGTFTNTSGATEVPVITTAFSSLLAAVAAFDVFASSTASAAGATIGTITGSATGSGGSDASVFNSKPMYLLVGNGITQATSTFFGIFSMTTPQAFPANVAAAGTTVVSIPNGASITPLLNAGTVSGNSFQLVATVPEPSSVVFGAIGVLGLLRRRRN